MNATMILDALVEVERERDRRQTDAVLGEAVARVKDYQHRRFALTYSDVLDSPRYGAAAAFFLEDIYGPRDFTARDAQFARVVPALVRLFPGEIVETVYCLSQLHALSERFDSAMGDRLLNTAIDSRAYARAWQAVGDGPGRELQISLLLDLGAALDRYTRKPSLRRSLQFMRVPARAAGLGQLQEFLERGFETFRSMNGAEVFLATVGERERALASMLFGLSAAELSGAASESDALGLALRTLP
jgi:hypothetical protein